MLGADGKPTKVNGGEKVNRQEGAHFDPVQQNPVIEALFANLDTLPASEKPIIASPDETDPKIFQVDWNGWSEKTKTLVGRLNVHTYHSAEGAKVRDIAKTAGKALWISEFDGSWPEHPYSLTDIANGIGAILKIIDHLAHLEPTAYIFWQAVEDLYNVEKEPPKGESTNWGSVYIDYDCNADFKSVRRIADGEADPRCKILTNSKFDTIRNFTHYIRPGDHFIPSNNQQTASALKADGSGLTLVHANSDASPHNLKLDLSHFQSIDPEATVKTVVTTESPSDNPSSNALKPGPSVPIDPRSKSADVPIPARSVVTLLVSGVHGIDDAAFPLRDGHSYQIISKQSGKALTASTSPATTISTVDKQRTTPPDSQLWKAKKLTTGNSNQERFVLTTSDGKVLAAADPGSATATQGTPTTLVARTADQATQDDRLQQWIPTTTSGETFSLVNAKVPRALTVNAELLSNGAQVNLYMSEDRDNQEWQFVDKIR